MDASNRQNLDLFIAQLEDPSCDHVGPYEKSGDNEARIQSLFAAYDYHIDDEGYAVPDEE